jgi:hypothetical protein
VLSGPRKLLASIKYQNAPAVVAKPLGIFIPLAESWLYISPSEAFFPPTEGTSVILISLKNLIYFITPVLESDYGVPPAIVRVILQLILRALKTLIIMLK